MNTSSVKQSLMSRLPIGMLSAFVLALVYSLFTGGVHMSSFGTTSSAANDTIAYNLGCEHARELIGAGSDSTRINYIMLETRARETAIRQKFGKGVSDSYVRGFETEIRSQSDSLARQLFNIID